MKQKKQSYHRHKYLYNRCPLCCAGKRKRMKQTQKKCENGRDKCENKILKN